MKRTHVLSFEMMPPRNKSTIASFWSCSKQLVALRPDFISITYGAGGFDYTSSLKVITKLVDDTPIIPIAHLTCIATPKSVLEETVDAFLDAGVRMFLALRGDEPKRKLLAAEDDEKLSSSAQLTHLIRMLDKKRFRKSAENKFTTIARPLVVCVAAFPNGNPVTGTSVEQEIDKLLEKQDAGADFAITQVYYSARDFDNFMKKASRAGVQIPILAGILPSWEPARLLKAQKNIGVQAPEELLRSLESAITEEDRYEIGLQFWTDLAFAALESGAPGIHAFTFNKPTPPTMLAQRLGLI
ncbi:MAG: methylenetetrahydrofolate reductase [Candidatus Ancillula trichonymphae]|jgi:methylenetetrahydrofolate reductase (NADPH)|nr:methylenetetrahydrofolate reductase [Candidatus Ancillula trichonymphae]